MRRVLFITWDGPQARYLETLFLPIFARLREQGYAFHVLQFTWGDRERIAETATACEALGIPYRKRHIWRGGGAAGPFLSALLGARQIARAARSWQIDILMPRGLMPALATLTLRPRERFQIVFDADGLPADERVDFAGLSPHSLAYRLLRDTEAEMVRAADRVLTRTSDAVAILSARAGAGNEVAKFHVVSNGVDPERFLHARAAITSPEADAPFRLCFCGSFGEKYCPETMLGPATRLRRTLPDLEFRIFTPDLGRARQYLRAGGLENADWIALASLRPQEVPGALAQCDLGFALVKATFSTRSVVAIKIGEYLLAGVPVICTSGVAGAQDLPESDVVYSRSVDDTDALMAWLERLRAKGKNQVREECQALGLAHFGIDATVRRYAAALAQL